MPFKFLPNRLTAQRATVFFALLLAVLGLGQPLRSQTVPTATASASKNVLASFPSPIVGHLAVNSNGDLFYVNETYSNSAILYWLPRGTTTPVQIATGFSGARNVYVDSANNLYVPNPYGGNVVEFPYLNNTYATGITITSSTPSCASYSPTVSACYQFGSVGAVAAYYYQPVDMAMDASGNAYMLNIYSNGSCTNACILKFTKGTSGGTYTPSLVASNVSAASASAQIAVDPAGDVFYTNGTLLTSIAAGTTTPVAFGNGLSTIGGLSTDYLGNLYVTLSASPYLIYEFPAVNNAVVTSKQFPVYSGYSGGAVGVSRYNEMYYLGYSGGNNLNVANLNSIPLGSSTVGTAVSTSNTSVTFVFTASTGVSSITSSGAGFTYTAGSCAAAAYAANGTCTVNVNYTPTAVGLQTGAVTLNNSSGVAVATALLSGTGQGALETNDPGTLSAIGSGFTQPGAVAVDGSGNVFVADSSANSVLRYAGGTGTPTSIGTGLKAPTAVALDNAGNVFIADSGNARVVKVPVVSGALANASQSVIYTGSGSTLTGIALDFAGNLYVADTAKTTVTELLNIGGVPSSASTLSVGTFTSPIALATDASGNLFVADYGANAVSRIAYVGRNAVLISSAFSKPTSVATDASGSVYVADSGNARVVKIPLEGTSFNTNDQYLISGTVVAPYAVAVDNAGNAYVADRTTAVVDKLNRSAGTLALGRVQIPQSTSSQNATIANAGNTSLIFGTPLYVAVSTTPTYFSVTAPSTNGCAAASTLASGYGCSLSAVFTPTTVGAATDVLTFNSNAINATKTLTLTGLGVDLAVDTLTLTQTSGTAVFGSPVTVQAAVTSAVAGTPTGTVSFTVDGNSQGTGTAINSSGITTITLTGLTGGAHTVCGSYTGDNSYRPANSCITVTVSKVASTTSLTISGAGANPVTSSVSQSVTFTAKVVPGATTPPTGTVTFSVGTTTLGTASLTASGSSYVATLQTTALPAGTDVITATYAGDVNYLTSSGTATIIVTYPTVIVTPATNALSVAQVGSVSKNLTVTALGGFAGSIGMQCSGLPANTVCSFSPNRFLLATDAPQTVTLTILTGQTPVVSQPVTGSFSNTWLGILTSLTLLAPLAFWKRRHLHGAWRHGLSAMLAVVGLGLSITASGCGGSQLHGDTPKGTYNVTVTASATTSAAYTYSGYASGCTATPAGGTVVTCSETAAVTLTVQ
ncbi:Ig-like domain repeat protein [Granulicella cerasi]|uniref:Ig-like domain repeat protein n=1 Tax=Granulicella cerasi TaxID=741063 RepID=A0ABW1Z6Y0_9BACT|nr:Ig-like domain repeat protein [Granulicella cerasi]